jgi:hypothetical protein
MRSTNQMAFPDVFKRRNFSISVNDALIDPTLLTTGDQGARVLNDRFAGKGYGTITLKPN